MNDDSWMKFVPALAEQIKKTWISNGLKPASVGKIEEDLMKLHFRDMVVKKIQKARGIS